MAEKKTKGEVGKLSFEDSIKQLKGIVESIEEAKSLAALEPDLLEWRIDAYNKVEIKEDCLIISDPFFD